MTLSFYYTFSQVSWFSSLESRAKITGTFFFLGPNEVAAFFTQYTMVLLGVFYYLKKGWNKWLLLALIIGNLFCVLFICSRAAYLALVVGLFLLFLVKDRKMLVLLIVVLIGWQVALPDKVKQRILQTTGDYGQLDESAERRLGIWNVSLDLFSKNPLAGIGYGVFRTLGYDLGDTHNIYIKVLVEQGVVGISILLVLMLCFFKEGYTLFRRGRDDLSKGFGLGFMACILALMVNNFFGDRFSYFELSSYLWIFAGLVSRLNRIEESEARDVYSLKQGKSPSPSVMRRRGGSLGLEQ
jgi:O-antigen ligase